MPYLRTWWGQLLVAAVAVSAPHLVISALSLATAASTAVVILREALLLVMSIGMMLFLLRAGPLGAADMGWRRPTIAALGWAILCTLTMLIAAAGLSFMIKALGLGNGFHQSMTVLNSVSARPLWMLVLIALTAGVSEEIIFRGIVLNYVTAASGRMWVGAAVSLAVFAVMHASGWGWGHVISTLAPGGVLTLFYLWKRDLGLNIIAHSMVDLLGLIAAAIWLHHA